jgi:hypothetical protein
LDYTARMLPSGRTYWTPQFCPVNSDESVVLETVNKVAGIISRNVEIVEMFKRNLKDFQEMLGLDR